MQSNETERRREGRRKAQSDEAQPLSDPQRAETNESCFLTANELQAWDPAKSAERRALAADRRRSADVPRTVHKQE